MPLSLKETLLIVIFATAFAMLPAMIRNFKGRGVQKWIDQFDGKITFNKDGMFVSKPSQELSIAWKNLVRVELSWQENPWGDPQFGRYCDTDWLLWSDSGKAISITESVNKTNSQILLEAFEHNLPGYKFDFSQFEVTHQNRLFEFEGGKVTVWARDSQRPT